MRSTIQCLKKLLKVNFKICHKTKRKSEQLINFDKFLKFYFEFYQTFQIYYVN